MSTGIDEIDALSKDVTQLKVSIAGMEPYVKQIPGIAESLVTLAAIMPKLEANMEDHKHIHTRLDGLTVTSNNLTTQLSGLVIEHSKCMEKNRLEEQQEAREERRQPDSIPNLIKKTVIPAIVAAVMLFTGWMLTTHLPEYLESIKEPKVQGVKK